MPGLVAGTPVDRHDAADARRSPRRQPAKRSRTGRSITITGTATDAGGGVVAGVEVSTDGGATLAPGDADDRRRHDASAGPTRGSPTATRARRSDRAPSTTAATSRRPSDAMTVNVACPCSIWGPSRPQPTPDVGRRQLGRRSASSSPADVAGTVTGIRFYKATREHRHARRQPVDRQRHAAGVGDVHATRRPPAGSRSPSPTRCTITAEHDLRRRLLRAQRPLLATAELLLPAAARRRARSLNSAAAARAVGASEPVEARAPTASTPTAAAARSPPSSYNGHQLLGRRRLRRRSPASRARSPSVSATAGTRSATVTWTAPSSGGPADDVHDHAVHRLDRADADDGDRRRRRRPARPSPA